MNQTQINTLLSNVRSLRALIDRVPTEVAESKKVRAILESLEKEAIGISDLIKNPDPMKSEAANTMIINQQKNRLSDMATKAHSDLLAIVQGERTRFEAARVEKSKLAPGEYAAEIRTVFRGLSLSEKTKFIEDATLATDGEAVAAIISVPAILTGISPEQGQRYREHFLNSVAPGSKTERDTVNRLDDVREVFMRVIDLVALPTS